MRLETDVKQYKIKKQQYNTTIFVTTTLKILNVILIKLKKL